jgi:hypothetical protein
VTRCCCRQLAADGIGWHPMHVLDHRIIQVEAAGALVMRVTVTYHTLV